MEDNKERGVIFTPELKETSNNAIDTAELEETVVEGVEEEFLSAEEELNKKNYTKITPTFYVRYLKTEEPANDEGEKVEIYKILNPKTGLVETRELTYDEKHQIVVKELQDSKIKFRNTVHVGNKTITKFSTDYRKKRQRKNKMAKASRKANRK
jgi:hypothetical protein